MKWVGFDKMCWVQWKVLGSMEGVGFNGRCLGSIKGVGFNGRCWVQ